MDSLTIEVMPDNRLSKNGLRKSNWRTSQTLMKEAREAAYWLGRAELPDGWETPEQATVQVVQYHARRPLDFDGLACVVAPSIDGLVDCGALADDDPGHLVGYTMGHVKVATLAENRIAITVVAVEGDCET
jgi:hypothetical protein